MNSIHDMGGMHGLGPIAPETDEPVFHEPWEARLFGLIQSYTAPEQANQENWRYAVECMPADLYLTTSYYEHWYYGDAVQLIESGMVTIEELKTGQVEPGSFRRDDAMRPEEVWPAIQKRNDGDLDIARPPRFAVGELVRTKNMHPVGHTRLPRYARSKSGLISAHRGANVCPESNAAGLGESPDHVYSVQFAARELWGPEAASKDKVYIDLWESYLEPVRE